MDSTRTHLDGPSAGSQNTVDVSIVVVTYNAGEYVRKCLESLRGEGRPTVSHEVIVLDNASSPSLVPLLREYLPEDAVVALPQNVGFGRACNAGAERARGRYVLLLNPDAEVRAGTVDALVRAADAEPRPGVVGGRTVTETGDVDPMSCWGAPSVWSTFCFATGLSTAFRGTRLFDPESLGRWQRDSVRDVDIVTGSLFLVPTDVWHEVGGFDTDYFMYGEDADLCRRIRDTGRRVFITPDAVAIHANGASSTTGNKTVLLMKGKVTYVRKHFSARTREACRRLLVLGVGGRAAAHRLAGRESGWVQAWARREEWQQGYAVTTAGAAS